MCLPPPVRRMSPERRCGRGSAPLQKLEIPTVCAEGASQFSWSAEPVLKSARERTPSFRYASRQRALDGVLGDEQGRGDLAVRGALRDELRDPALCLGQRTALARASAIRATPIGAS